MLDRHTRFVLAAILAVALLVRVGVILGTPDFVPVSDAADYDAHGVSIANGDGYPDTLHARPGSPSALRPPGYPSLLGAIYLVRGDYSWDTARMVGALLGTLTVLLLWLIARELIGTGAALVAAAIAAIFPPLVMLNASLVSETLFVPLELAGVLAVLAFRRDSARLRWAIAAGALCGLAALTRSVGVLLLVPIVVGLWSAATRRRVVAPLLAVVSAALVIAPWTVRNARVFDAFVPLSTQGGVTAAGIYNGHADTRGHLYAVWRPPQSIPDYAPLFHGSRDEAELDAELGRAARRYALDHPGYVATAAGLNALRTFDLGPDHTTVTKVYYREMGIPRRLWRAVTIGAWAVAVLAGVGLVALRRRMPRGLGWVWLVPILTYVSSLPITGGERYRAPADPFLVMLAGAGALVVARAIATRSE